MKVVEPVQAQLIKYSDMLMSQLLNSFKCKVSDLLVANYLFYCCHCPWLDPGHQRLSHNRGWGHVWRPGTCDLVSRLSHTLIGISSSRVSANRRAGLPASTNQRSARQISRTRAEPVTVTGPPLGPQLSVGLQTEQTCAAKDIDPEKA